jgi:DNA-directed RNA polymerase II subunit RPB2
VKWRHRTDFQYDNHYAYDEDVDPDEFTLKLWQEACWIVINAYFKEKRLLRQQLDSFDEFIQMSAQRIVKDSSVIDMMVELHHFSDEIHTPLCLPWLTF